jgi:endonuclease/exonuclease/phosphatase family metal-dependent hydrolase
MRKAVGTDRRRDPARVLQVLKEVDADVIALQEADRRTGGRAAAVPHELIDAHGHYRAVPFTRRDPGRAADRRPAAAGRRLASRP